MVIPIIVPMPMQQSSGFGGQTSGSYRTPLGERLRTQLKDMVTTRKSPERLAQSMLKKAVRQLRVLIEEDEEYSLNRNWHYTGSFDERWVDQSVNDKFTRRNEAFELFKPLMKACVFRMYGVEVEVKMEILSSEYDTWVDYRWTITPPQPPASPKWFGFFRRRR